ncbi:MAG: putative 2-succinyl-6-hydroxy-2,4-cyclohexadiene-1-carboxylate synthase [Leptospiraceae bacterium]|nr:MAG: putative 2-succinyl-6-hydroxy-2,4-cyclohexadiene-1-carboxylate synthase [Leptospiraceae bacterium]
MKYITKENFYYIIGKILFSYRKYKLDKRILKQGFYLNAPIFEGIKVYYYTNFKNKPDPEKKHLVLLHGFLDSSHTFRKILSYIKNDFNVYIIDIPGHGKTKVPYIRELWQISTLTRGLYRFIYEYLNLQFPILLTHSMGGFLVFHMLKYAQKRKEFPEKFNCILFAIAPGMLRFEESLREKNMRLFFPSTIEDIDNLLQHIFPVQMPEIPIFIKYYLLREWNHPGMKYLTQNTLENEDEIFYTETLLKKNPQPHKTYFIWGTEDKIVPLKYAKKLLKLVKNSKLITIENTGHTPHSERPEAFFTAIQKYLYLYK